LVKSGADINAKDEAGRTPLHKAVSFPNNSTSTVEFLVKAGAVVDAKDIGGQTPLQVAARIGLLDKVEFLLRVGADVSAGWGHSPLHLAARVGSVKVMAALIKAGADVNSKDSLSSDTPLHYAAWWGSPDAAVLRLMGPPESEEYKEVIATFNSLPEATEAITWLLEAGADVRATNKFGKTPFAMARRGNKEILWNAMMSTPVEVPKASTNRTP
jgi:ankyrin repeat protein